MQIDASAPTRIDFAGGTLDIWPLYLFHEGAQTLNAAISLRAHCRIRPRSDRRIVIVSEDTGTRVDAAHWSELRENHELKLLGRLLHFFQAEGLDLHTRSESPVGAGIAGSSALNIAVCGALDRWRGSGRTADQLMEVAKNVEAQAIDVPTGVQDYRPAMFGGIAAVELGADGIRRVALPVDAAELERRLVLAYTNASRNSGINNWEVTKRHIDGDRVVQASFARISSIASEMRRAFEAGDWDAVAVCIGDEWQNRKRLAPGVTTPEIDALLAAARQAGARAGKVCGAGGGGCLFCIAEPRDVPAVRAALASAGARVLDFRIERVGLLVDADAPAGALQAVDNLAISRVLAEIGDLLEIKNENPFKIRAYRNAAETLIHLGEPVAGMAPAERLRIPGIGKDLAAKIGEILETGTLRYHQELLQEFPPTILDLLRLQGVGPKTVALLYHALGVRTLEDLEAAARDGRVRALKGMGARKETQILTALEHRQRFAGRRPTAEVSAIADALVAELQSHAPGAFIAPVGSLRRGCESCGDLDILAAGAPATLMGVFTGYRLVQRVLAHGDTKSSVLLHGGLQADLRLVEAASRGAALQYFTGSKAHNIALRDRAIQRGLKLNEYGLFRVEDDSRVAGESEEEIYTALGLAPVPPELRENRGELAAAEAGTLPRLVTRDDLRGDLHMHTTASDGRADAETMAAAARAAGLDYIAITDHSQSLAMAGGLDEARALEHARRVRALNHRLDGITLLAGIECDILPDGSMDLDDACLAELDIVIASVHSAFNQSAAQMTERLLRAIANPWVDVLGHPTGRLIAKRDPYDYDFDRVVDAAAAAGVAFEINSLVDRLDLDDTHARRARDRGARLVVDSDAHSPAALDVVRWGTATARRAWLGPDDILNTRPVDSFRASLRRARTRPA